GTGPSRRCGSECRPGAGDGRVPRCTRASRRVPRCARTARARTPARWCLRLERVRGHGAPGENHRDLALGHVARSLEAASAVHARGSCGRGASAAPRARAVARYPLHRRAAAALSGLTTADNRSGLESALTLVAILGRKYQITQERLLVHPQQVRLIALD